MPITELLDSVRLTLDAFEHDDGRSHIDAGEPYLKRAHASTKLHGFLRGEELLLYIKGLPER